MGHAYDYFKKWAERIYASKILSIALLSFSLLILLTCVVYVGHKSAIIQSNNSDQLIDGYMFSDWRTFRGDLFPASHTFLIKWPLFMLVAAMGNTLQAFHLLTIAVFGVTILGFVIILYFLSGRSKQITAVLALALASVLLLVPAQPSDAVLLPVNMAMLTTRNIEFLVFFGYLYLMMRTTTLRSVKFWTAAVLLVLLGASDKFFLMLALVAAVFDLLYSRAWKDSRFSIARLYPLTLAVVGYIGTTILLYAINLSHLTTVDNPSAAAPFNISNSVSQMFEGVAGAIQGTVLNFGANVFGKPASLHLLPYLINGIIMIAAFVAIYRLFFQPGPKTEAVMDEKWRLGYWLALTALAAYLVYIVSDHTFAFDARYLTGIFFAGFAALALYARQLPQKSLPTLLLVCTLGLIITLPATAHLARTSLNNTISANQQELGNRTDTAAKIVSRNNVKVFAGDYWFTDALKVKVPPLRIAPLSTGTCDAPNNFLTSNAWYRPDPTVHLSAYYILRDAGDNATTFNHGCTLAYLQHKYGTPVKQYIIRGDKSKPIDIINIYNYDVRSKLQ